MSLSPDQKLVNLTQYKELAAKVGVARYGSKTDLVSRIKGVSGGKDKLQTLIDKAKKSIVVHKKKKAVGSPKKKTPTKSCPKGGCDAGEDFEEFIECLTIHLQDKLEGYRPLVDRLLKVFDEDIAPQQLNALSATEAIKQLALVMTHVEASDDEEGEEEEEE
jgi:hypothetical protein